MGNLLAVTIGGGIGSLMRYWLAGMISGLGTGPIPMAIPAVNILGSLVMGALAESFALRFDVSPEVRAFLTVGVLGGFTTFSSFSLEAALLIRRNDLFGAGLYVALSVILSIAALFAGMWLARLIFD